MKKQALPALPSLPWSLPTHPRSRTLSQLCPGHLSWLLYRGSPACPPFVPVQPPGPGSPLDVPGVAEVCPQPPACSLSWGTTGLYLGKAGLSVKHKVSGDARCLRRVGFVFCLSWKRPTFTCSSQHEPVLNLTPSPLRGSSLSPGCSCPQGQLMVKTNSPESWTCKKQWLLLAVKVWVKCLSAQKCCSSCEITMLGRPNQQRWKSSPKYVLLHGDSTHARS